jgi:predicted membrane chloride channel (bestrophin family)
MLVKNSDQGNQSFVFSMIGMLLTLLLPEPTNKSFENFQEGRHASKKSP